MAFAERRFPQRLVVGVVNWTTFCFSEMKTRVTLSCELFLWLEFACNSWQVSAGEVGLGAAVRLAEAFDKHRLRRQRG